MTWLAWVILIIGGYLLGSIPSAYIVVKLKKGTDIRQIGSGNIGATNTIRAAGRGTGVLVFLMDMAKGAIPTLVGMAISRDLAIVAGFAAFIGHLFPIWLNFKGGKGVSTAFGVALAMYPLYALFCISLWFIVMLATGYVSLGSCCGTALMPFISIFTHQPLICTIIFIIIAFLVCWRHRENFRNIKAGTEGRSFRRKN